MALNWQKLIDLLDKRPMSALLGLSWAICVYSMLDAKEARTEHIKDLQDKIHTQDQAIQALEKAVEVLQYKNSEKWIMVDTIRAR